MGGTTQGTERRVFVGGMPFSYEVISPSCMLLALLAPVLDATDAACGAFLCRLVLTGNVIRNTVGVKC